MTRILAKSAGPANAAWALGAIALVGLLSAMPALAQQSHFTGALATPPERLQSIPETAIYRAFLPEAVDLSKYFPAIGDQLQQSSCVGWATGYAARAYYAHQIEHRPPSSPAAVPSPAYVYNSIHDAAVTDCSDGTYLPDALDLLQNGALSIAAYPYLGDSCAAPSASEVARATDFKIESYEAVDVSDADQIKGQLAEGNPVVVIALLDNSFFDLVGKAVWHSNANRENAGGHAFTIVGYDDRAQVFKFINSWGTGWGDNGYGRMDYATATSRVVEGYVMHLPGDPSVVLQDADYVADPLPTERPALIIPFNVRPNSRDVGPEAVALTGVACGRVNIGVNDDGERVATGFVGTTAELDAVSAQLKDIVSENLVAIAPWPACEVHMTLDAALTDTDTPRLVVDPAAPVIGDTLSIGVTTPGFASYVYAAYFSADGSVLNIAQPSSADLRAKGPHSQLSYGGGGPNEASFTVEAPVGDELLLVVTSERPLFAAARPASETDRQFLTGLREAVLAGESGRVTATLIPVTTTQ